MTKSSTSAACAEARDATAVDPVSEVAAERVRLHRIRCDECRRWSEDLEDVAEGVRRAGSRPLDDLARARIAASLAPFLDELAARPPRRNVLPAPGRRAWAALGLALVATLLLVVWRARRPLDRPAPIAVVMARLDPYVVAGDGAALVATLGVGQTRIALGAASLARFALDDGAGHGHRARLTLVGPALLEVVAPEPAAAGALALRLDAGLLLVEDDHHAGPLEVRSPGAVTRVLGTAFAVDAGDGTMTRVTVVRGSVEVGAEGQQPVRLDPGQSWATGATLVDPHPPATLEPLLAEHLNAAPPAAPGAPAGRLAVTARPAAAAIFVDGAPLGPAPLWALLPAGDRAVTARAPDHRAAAVTAHLDPAAPVTLDLDLPPDVAPAPPAPATPLPSPQGPVAPPRAPRPTLPPATPPAPAPEAPSLAPRETAEELYARAEAALRAGDRDRGRTLLVDVVRRFPDDGLADTALYELARFAQKEGDPEHTRAYLDELLARGRDSSLREPATWLRCRLDVDARRDAPARRCLTSFRASFPSSPHDAEALALLAALLHIGGDCAAARPLLDEYLRSYPGGPFADEALARRARCAATP